MIGLILYLASIVALAIGLFAAIGTGVHNALAWFIAGVLLYVVAQLIASWETARPKFVNRV